MRSSNARTDYVQILNKDNPTVVQLILLGTHNKKHY